LHVKNAEKETMSKNDKRKATMEKAKAAYENLNAQQRGELLTALIQLYHQKQDQTTLMPVMQCLMDNVPVGVPMKVSEEDMKLMKEAKENKTGASLKVSMKTVILKHPDGRAYMPVFSRQAEVPKEFFEKYYWLQMPFKQCAKLVSQMENVEEIVINTFTHKLFVPKKVLESMTLVDDLRPADEMK